MPHAIAGFDIGGTKVSLVLADERANPIDHLVEPTNTRDGTLESADGTFVFDGLGAQLWRMLERALADHADLRLQAIGIVSAGPIRDGGLWCPPNIVPEELAKGPHTGAWTLPVVSPLRRAFACPVQLINDCSGAVLGEIHFGLGREGTDKRALHLAYVTISTGFGVGAWDGGRLVLGKDGNAGELGHVLAREDGLPCGCGNRGCVEAYASGAGLVKNLAARRGRDDASMAPPAIFNAAEGGDSDAQAAIDDLVYAAGVGLSAVANAYDPDTISVGGSVILAHPELLRGIEEEMKRHLNVISPRVQLTPLGAQVTEFGALALARELAGSDG